MNGLLVIHAVHTLLAGFWVGGLMFTAVVVSPAFKRMEWSPPERTAVRSAVGRQYSKVARPNLALLFVAALFDWLPVGLGAIAVTELALIALVFLLSELHGLYFAPRLAQAARARDEALRSRIVRVSVSVSMLNLTLSIVVIVLSSLRSL